MAKIEVVIKDATSGNSTTTSISNQVATPQQVAMNSTPTTQAQVSNVNFSKGLAVAGLVGNQMLSYATSNVGKWTGNSNNQIFVDDIKQAIAIGTAFAVNPFMGAASLGITLGTRMLDYQYERKYEEISLANKRIRAGYTSNGDVVSRRRYN